MSSFRIVEHQVPCQHIREYPQALAGEQEDVLHLAVKQYIPKSNPDPQPGDITIIAAHANAFPKELYEALWDDLLAQSEKDKFRIRAIWMADVAHQGQSSVMNEHLLGNDPGWNDHARDLLHMINLKRSEMPRPLVGIGHSMGGAHLVSAALMHPRLFTSLVLLDPVVQERSAEIELMGPPSIAQLSTFRRDIWPSRSEAAKSFKTQPFYATWDSRVLDKWIEFGLRDLPTNLYPESQSKDGQTQVTLTTTAAQEVTTFLRPNFEGYGYKGKPVNRTTHADVNPNWPNVWPFYRPETPNLFLRLPELRPSVFYVFGGTSFVSPEHYNKAKLERTGSGPGGSGGAKEGRVKGVTLEDIGHLVAMEAPQRTAAETSRWLGSEMESYRQGEEAFQKMWKAMSLVEKQSISEKWKQMMGGPPKRPKKKESKM